MDSVVNIAAYKFADIGNLAELRGDLRELCAVQNLRGTILLSNEGINLFVAGPRVGIDALLARLKKIPALADLEVKESLSREIPFNRMLVKIKREIIAFGIDAIDPKRHTSPRVSAAELKRWLDEDQPVTLLDTRNDFEVRTGTFKNALAIGIDDFRNFPAAVEKLPEEIKDRPVVTFCTGGIRCEKAAPYLEQAGFTKVFQLDGGILKYFAECGGEHYEGDCFVFDKRVAVNSELAESSLRQCFVCQAILTPPELASPQYELGKSCPHCFPRLEERRLERLRDRQEAIRRAATPLPGSAPYDNVRPIRVSREFDGWEVLDFLGAIKTYYSREDWLASFAAGEVHCRGELVRPGWIVRAGDRLQHKMAATVEPDVAAEITLLYEDDWIVVVNKPAPLPMHPCGRFNRNTLIYILNQAFHPLYLRPAHRLDADTAGVVVLAKTRFAAGRLQPQFDAGKVIKTYLARVHGHPAQDRFACHAPLSDDPGPGGVRLPDAAGLPASTEFRVLERELNGTALLEVKPLTGRTNQIRAHLWSLGFPIVGDPIYLPEGKLGSSRTLSLADPPLCLHAERIEFTHPESGERVSYEAKLPERK